MKRREQRQRDYDHGYGVGYEDGIKESALEIESLRGAMRVLEEGYERIKVERDDAIRAAQKVRL